MSSCRFCRMGHREDKQRLDLVKYGVRHYAHPDCLLAAKGAAAWDCLGDWQLERFPYFAAQRAGLADSLQAAIAGRKQLRAEQLAAAEGELEASV